MTLRPRSLYFKIFLWFCLTILVSTSLVFFVAALAGSQPFGRRWMAMTQDLYAHSAVDFYSSGGAPALSRYLATISRDSSIDGYLLTPEGADVLGRSVPDHAMGVYRRAKQTRRSVAHLGRYWTAASLVDDVPTSGSPTHYIFVMEAHPLRGFLDGTFFNSVAPRMLGGILLVAVFCLLLARHITKPIRLLETAATRMAGGDLSVRTVPALRGRADELASMAAAFDSMAERIETLLRTQRQMLADISHELRSPLTRIGVSLELLRRGEVDVLEPMEVDLDRLNSMIGQVLELTRFELQEESIPAREVDIERVLEDIVESANYEGRASGKSVMLTSSGACVVIGEESALRSCIENIVRNALQHSPTGGQIDIFLAHALPDWIEVRVDDRGPGVPAEALPHLFAPFFRVPGSSVVHPSGSGLGLSIAARIVSRYDGSIRAANRSPHGLSIHLTLPCAPASFPQL
jgi:two-component system sensor histidine kinase CpxA